MSPKNNPILDQIIAFGALTDNVLSEIALYGPKSDPQGRRFSEVSKEERYLRERYLDMTFESLLQSILIGASVSNVMSIRSVSEKSTSFERLGSKP